MKICAPMNCCIILFVFFFFFCVIKPSNQSKQTEMLLAVWRECRGGDYDYIGHKTNENTLIVIVEDSSNNKSPSRLNFFFFINFFSSVLHLTYIMIGFYFDSSSFLRRLFFFISFRWCLAMCFFHFSLLFSFTFG